jgi:hypothetical protein
MEFPRVEVQKQLVEAAINCYTTSSSFQSEVRKAIRSGLQAEELAEVVTSFRRELHERNPNPSKEERKKINNIINDISRISRKEFMKSIVCDSRKAMRYSAKDWIKRSEVSLPDSPDKETLTPLKNLIEELTPSEHMDYLVKTWCGLYGKEYVATRFLKAIKKVDSKE